LLLLVRDSADEIVVEPALAFGGHGVLLLAGPCYGGRPEARPGFRGAPTATANCMFDR
jgi:hypothetical protein